MSVINQEYPNFEYILIDGGSSDESVDIIRKHSASIAYWQSEQDRGFGDAINTGFAKATGDIFCWLNSDDKLMPGALMTVGKYFLRHESIGVVFGDRCYIDEKSSLLYLQRNYFFLKNQFIYRTIPQEATFWRKEFFYQVGALDEGLKYAIDLDLWCRLSKVTTFKHLPFYFGCFRIQKDSKSSTIGHIGKTERDGIVLKYYNRNPSKLEKAVFNFVFENSKRLYRILGIHFLKKCYFRVILK